MDFHVIDSEGGLSHHGMSDDGDAEPGEGGEANHVENSLACEEDGISEPYVGMEFNSEDAARTFYDEYARCMGFSSKAGHFSSQYKTDGTIVAREFVCGREGLKRSAESCSAMIRIELKGEKWVVIKFVKEHSHSVMTSRKVHYLRPRRHFAGAAKTMADSYQGVGVVPSGMMYVSMDGNHVSMDANNCGIRKTPPAEANCSGKNVGTLSYAFRPVNRKRMLGRDAQNLLDYFKKMQAENPGFFYAIQLDEDNRMANVFWADARSRTAYMHFGDAVKLDTSYRVNQYRVPFAPFTGLNHHGQMILFGCALLFDDSEASFVWLFKTFLTAMNDRRPVSLITDQDRAIQTAMSQVFPGVPHCINKWHVLREGPEKLAHIFHVHPNFQAELYNCINLTETIEEFELSWSSIIEKYNLGAHDWLHSLYNARAQWVPAYFRDSFFAAITPNQGFDGSFFDGYVNQQTTLPIFFRQYELAIENWFEREIEADFDTICTTPVLRTPSPMEKQAADLYTRKIFTKFQEELVETFVYTANRIEGDGAISTFRVAKYEDVNKVYMSGVGTDECGGDLHGQESLTSRYNSLCQEAIKYAEDGAIATETFNVAMAALNEVGKKVSVVKKTVAKLAPPDSLATGAAYDDKKSSTSAPDTAPSLWPQQDEITRHFNLNDTGTPAQSVSDLNLPRMAPVSLHRDDTHPDNMPVLPCLKSMRWLMENKNSKPENRLAVIILKLQDYSNSPSAEMDVKFQLSRITLEPMLRSMAYISEQLSTPANRVAVINLKLQDTETSTGESEVKFQVSRDTLGAMLRSMAYIREQLSSVQCEPQAEPSPKKHRK
ncbi:hypothetical protein V6Z12_D08G236300 [Gossypium hirsutum]